MTTPIPPQGIFLVINIKHNAVVVMQLSNGHSTVLIGPSKACLVIMILRVHVLNNMAE